MKEIKKNDTSKYGSGYIKFWTGHSVVTIKIQLSKMQAATWVYRLKILLQFSPRKSKDGDAVNVDRVILLDVSVLISATATLP